MSPGGVEIIGHRGYAARYPENTLPSLLAALDAGARAVEFDVRVAACGTPVLFHDATLERTTSGTGALADHDLGALRSLDAGSWFDPAFAGTLVPTLEEALRVTLARPDGPSATRLYVEIKAVREPADVARILALVERARARDRVILISLDFEILAGIRRLDDRIRIGYVVAEEEAMDAAVAAVRQDPRSLLDPDQHLLRAQPRRTSDWVNEGLRVATWTVNEELHARELLALGVRRLTTDRPGELLESPLFAPGVEP
jgi:glycerophosphoryl diester phosphodiesterase